MWLCYENPEGWAELMKAVDNGEDPSGIDVNASANVPTYQDESEDETWLHQDDVTLESYSSSEEYPYYGSDTSVDGLPQYE